MDEDAPTLTRFTDLSKKSHAVRRLGSIRLNGMLMRASMRGPGGQPRALAEDSDAILAPPPDFQSFPWEAPPQQPAPGVTSDPGPFRSLPHSGGPDPLLAQLLSGLPAPLLEKHGSLQNGGVLLSAPSSGEKDMFSVSAPPPPREALSPPSNAATPGVDPLFQRRPPSPLAPPRSGPSDGRGSTLFSGVSPSLPPGGTATTTAGLTPALNPFRGADLFSPLGPGTPPWVPARPRPPDLTLTSPLGSRHGVLQPTPFSLALGAGAAPPQPALSSGDSLTRPVPRARTQRPSPPPPPAAGPVEDNAVKTPPKPPPKPSLSLTSPLSPRPLTPEPLTSEPFRPRAMPPRPALKPSFTSFNPDPFAPGPTPTLTPAQTLGPLTDSSPEPWMTQRPTPTQTPTSTSTPTTQLSGPPPSPAAIPAVARGPSTPLGPGRAPPLGPRQAGDTAEEEEDVVYLDILLTGEEKCVEDWPEHSPQLDPLFKPSGTLRLRRESMRVNEDPDSDGYSTLDHPDKKRGKRFRKSSFLKGSLKDKYLNLSNGGKGETLKKRDSEAKADPSHQSPSWSSKEAFPETTLYEDELEEDMDGKPSKAKARLGTFLRRASETPRLRGKADGDRGDGDRGNASDGQWAPGAEDEDVQKLKVQRSDSLTRRWSEGMLLDEEDEDLKGASSSGLKKKNKLEIKFVPQRGFAITRSKGDGPEALNTARIHTPQSAAKAAFPEEDNVGDLWGGLYGDDLQPAGKDGKPKGKKTSKQLHTKRRSSQEDMLEDAFAERWGGGEEDGGDYTKQKHLKPKSGKLKAFQKSDFLKASQMGEEEEDEEDAPHSEADLQYSPWGTYEDEETGAAQSKPKKSSKLKRFKKPKEKTGSLDPDPPGATSRDYYVSEAAEAEWRAAQRDERLAEGLQNGEEEGDTDSLMEWWNTVEQWDEVPSDDEDLLKEDETKSFTALADKVHRGLRVFDKLFTERAERLWQYIVALHAITDDISDFHRKAKIANITGGTTTAVGGVAAILGLVLIPPTFGASLLLTAIGVGVVAAGGITSASASISDTVNNMHDRKKLEIVLKAYESRLLDLDRVLRFLTQGMYRLRGHPLLRAGNQHYAAAWEVRLAVQTLSQADRPVDRASAVTEDSLVALRGLFQGMDKYFVKDSRELKKGAKAELVAEVRGVVAQLNDGLVELSAIRQELQEATGAV